MRCAPFLLILAAGCAGGGPARESRPLPSAVRDGDPTTVAAALRSTLEAAGWPVDRAEAGGVTTRLREEPEEYSWQVEIGLAASGTKTDLQVSLVVDRPSLGRPVQGLLRNNARMQVDDQYLETGNRSAYERDRAQIDANSPEGRREAAIRKLEERVRAVLQLPPSRP